MGKAAKDKFYAVRTGREPGVYHSWPEAQKQVNGFPKAKHQAFKTLEAAQAFVNAGSASATVTITSGNTRTPPTSSTSSSSRVSVRSTSSTRSHASTPYERPTQPSKARKVKNQSGSKKPYQYTRLDMVWTPKIETELIKAGWLIAFTDGACQDNGKYRAAAGAGVFWANPRTAPNVSERVPGKQSNQTGELYAILRALEVDPDPAAPLHIFTDSQYSIKCLTEWITKWMASGWKTTDGEPVVNLELIKLVHFMISKREGPVELSWVKGHSNVPGNKMADRLAVQGVGRDVPHFRNFEAEREERFLAWRLSKRGPEAPDISTSKKDDANDIDDSWLLDPDEELAELEEEDF